MTASRQTLTIAGALGFLGVALGAFGAHALKPTLLAVGRLDTFELAVRYQFYHALVLLFLGCWMDKNHSYPFQWSALLLFLGVMLFCGSLYLLALTGITALALITPLGGVLLLTGWAFLIYGFLKSPSEQTRIE